MSEFYIEAANGSSKPKVVGMAYGGGKINVGWMESIVVDLAGMSIPEQIPLLANHDNRTAFRVGMISAYVEDNQLKITGEIIAETEEAQNIVSQAKAGAEWQLSIGADVLKCEFIKENMVATINGQNHEGPFYHVLESSLREVSVVAVGADATTSMSIAAKFNFKGACQMSKEPEGVVTEPVTAASVPAAEPVVQVQAQDAKSAAAEAIKAERQRVADIQEICAGEFSDVEKEAIKAGWDVDKTRAEVLAKLRASTPQAAPNVIVSSSSMDAKSLTAAFALRSGIGEDEAIKAYGEKAVEMGAKNMDISLKEVVQECLRLEGRYSGRSFDNETIRAGFSSVTLPGILSDVANKRLLKSFNEQPIIATKLCSVGDLNDFKETERLRLTDVGDLKEVAADGEIKDGGLIEESATNQLSTYGKRFCLTRQMIINDDLGALLKVPTAMGAKAARLIDQLFFQRLLKNPNQGDGHALFCADHNNLLSGAESALGIQSLQKAIGLFLDQVDAGGDPISVEPRFLLVPTALKFLALELTRGDTIITTGTAAERTSLNALADERLEVVSSPYLGNANYAGSSKTGWYLFGDPRQVETFEIGYYKGKRTPTVEQGETDFNTLGMWFRVYFDVGVREQGFRGMAKAIGA
jgi:hypothetical protein